MTVLASSLHVRRSRQRFITFGGALILAACLTLMKMTFVTVDMREQDILAWPHQDHQSTPQERQTQSELLFNQAEGTHWPAILPEPAAGPATQDNGGPESAGDSSAADDTQAGSELALALDPSALTDGQIQALQQLATRSQELDERERLLNMRAELNGRTEERLDQQISQLTMLKEQIEALVQGLDEAEEQKLARLVKIYETMKPKAAAEIFNRLEIPILLHVVERMKEAKSAVVLGKMNPAIAQRVTTELARRKERPNLDGQGLGS